MVIKLIVGDYRQNKLALKVLPASGEASEDTAELFAGLIRNVEASSNADMAYVNALECAARGGFGYFRILTEYAGEDTLRQELVIRPIHNPLTVHFDPLAKQFARQDARYCFVTETVPKDQFEQQYPDASTSWFDTLTSEDRQNWMDGDAVRVAEVFEKEDEPVRVVALASGVETVIESDDQLDALLAIGEQVVGERQAKRTRVRWRKVTAGNVLEETLLPIPYIPIVPVLGEEVLVEGKTLLRGALYYSKDAQRMISYWNTAATETVALAPKSRTKLTPEQYEGNEDTWNPANPTNVALYNASGDAAGHPFPQEITPPLQPVGEMSMAQGAEGQFKATTGVYDAMVGNKSNASSGVAIGALQRQGESTTFLWVDNLRKSIEWAGRILISWIPHVYDTERVVRILDLEGNPKTEVVNQQKYDAATGITRVLNSLSAGRYDVVVTTGPSVATQRLEMLQQITQLMQVMPIVGQAAPDLIVKALPFEGAEEIAERVKRTLPPQVTEEEDEPQQAQQQQQQQMMMQSQQQQMQQAQAAQQAQAETEQLKLETERTKAAAAKLKADGELALAQEQLKLKQMELQIERLELGAKLAQLAQPQLPSDGDSAPAGQQASDQQP